MSAGVAFGPIRASRLHGRWSVRISAQSLFGIGVCHPAPFLRVQSRELASGNVDRSRRRAGRDDAGSDCFRYCVAVCNARQSNGRLLLCFCGRVERTNLSLGPIPNRAGSRARNDASLFLALLSGGSDAHAILLYHSVTQVRRQGFRPCFYPEHIIRAVACAQAPAEFQVLFPQTVCEWALDRGRTETADAWDRRALDWPAPAGSEPILMPQFSRRAWIC